jgi:hypothetical protein
MPAWPAYQIFLSREEGPEKSSLQTAREDFSSAKEIRANDTSTSISEFSKNIDYLDPPSAQKKGPKVPSPDWVCYPFFAALLPNG